MTEIKDMLPDMLSDEQKNTVQMPVEYIKNDLKYCSICNTPRECIIDFLGTEYKMPCICKCQAEEMDREKKQKELEQKKDRNARKTDELIRADAAIRPIATFEENDNLDPENTRHMTEYVREFDRMADMKASLMLFGENGCGKTFFAECIANSLTEKGYFVWYTSLSKLYKAFFSGYKKDWHLLDENLEKTDLLILDDFGSESNNSAMSEVIKEVIHERYFNQKKPILITTNLDPSEMAAQLDASWKPTYERIMEMCVRVHIEGKTRRSQIAREKNAKVRQILGV